MHPELGGRIHFDFPTMIKNENDIVKIWGKNPMQSTKTSNSPGRDSGFLTSKTKHWKLFLRKYNHDKKTKKLQNILKGDEKCIQRKYNYLCRQNLALTVPAQIFLNIFMAEQGS